MKCSLVSGDGHKSVTAGVPWLRNYFQLVQEFLGGQYEKKQQMVWIEHPAIAFPF